MINFFPGAKDKSSYHTAGVINQRPEIDGDRFLGPGKKMCKKVVLF